MDVAGLVPNWSALLDSLEAAVAYCVFAARVDDALDALQRDAAYRLKSAPIVMLTWPDAPRIDQAIQDVAFQLAKAMLAAVSNRQSGELITKESRNDRWLDKVRWLSEAGSVPLPDGYPIADSFRRFARAISKEPLTCILVLEGDANFRPVHLDGLCRGAQWIALHTGGRVALLLNESFRGDPALASIDFYSRRLQQDATLDDASEIKAGDDITGSQCGEQKLRLWPYLGQPHPFSPGEQLLCAAFSSRNLLAGRFTFNEVIETADSKRYIVDILDRELGLVIEVDGYRHHSSQAAFSADRDRDFRLHVNGYLVLRLPHHEVVRDVNTALDKIDTLVRYRQATMVPVQDSLHDRD